MGAPESMWTLAGRLASFETAHQPTKRRASSRRGSSKRNSTLKTHDVLSWPHKKPSAKDVAKAGFYYTPTAQDPDNVTCFLCHKALDGWEEEDSPAQEHSHHSKGCAFAIIACIEERTQNNDEARIEEDPMSAAMVEARKATYGDRWPHEQKKGWNCKTDKMVGAGWYYCPTAESDDFVSCAYCGLSVDGWEPKDKPLEEHRRRAPTCLFFEKKTSKATKGRKRTIDAVQEVPVESSPPARKRRNTKTAAQPSKRQSVRRKKEAVVEVRSSIGEEASLAVYGTPLQTPPKSPKSPSPPQHSPLTPPAVFSASPCPSKTTTPGPRNPTPRADSTPATRRPKSPTQSPAQSSDAENHPQSSAKVPLATSTPKRNNTPLWEATDLENVFLQSPSRPFNVEKSDILCDVVNGCKGNLTSPEKTMTVEEWIRFNATLGEERLRGECERLVSVFEREGNRALEAIQGIQAAG
ncbi:MAG: hypothetical protein M1817_001996 [Caeruleum heppii]|nr:MAG: hypothetical protein M1817_001996 [Caeruleum heppii]